LENAAIAYSQYLNNMVWPKDLTIYYTYPRSYDLLWVLAAAAFLAGVSIAAWRWSRQYPYMIMGWLWYIGSLVPVIGLVQIGEESRADRYTYVPLVGVFVMVAWGASTLASKWKINRVLLASGALAATGLLAIAANGQVRYWKNSIVLWEHALEVTTWNYRAHSNIGGALADEGRLKEALEHLEESVRIKPDFVDARNNYGNALVKVGRLEEGIRQYEEAIRIRPNFENAHNGLGSALDDQGKFEEAIAHYKAALRANPEHIGAQNNLGVAYAKQGKFQDALTQFQKVLSFKPSFADAHFNAAVMLRQLGRLDEAAKELASTLQFNPKHEEAAAALQELNAKNQ
jgi:tetratricopeptide (TPR) repeat protein